MDKTAKRNKRKKIRRLANKAMLMSKPASICKRILIFIVLCTATVALLMGHYFTQNNTNTKHIIKEFLKNYRNQYTQIIHGKQNYCDPKSIFESQSLIERVKQYRILHQEKALQEIESALRNDSDINAIALLGSVGVGKSLFMQYTMENFPWQDNIHAYAWNTYEDKDEDKFNMIRLFVESLSECGTNLMVIENLKPRDRKVVTIVNNLVRESLAKQRKRVIIFYVFNLNTMLPKEAYDEDRNGVQALTDCNVINFKTFSEIELRDCIQREAEIENRIISPQDADEIVNLIDPFKSGCKNVNAKVIAYGKRMTKDVL